MANTWLRNTTRLLSADTGSINRWGKKLARAVCPQRHQSVCCTDRAVPGWLGLWLLLWANIHWRKSHERRPRWKGSHSSYQSWWYYGLWLPTGSLWGNHRKLRRWNFPCILQESRLHFHTADSCSVNWRQQIFHKGVSGWWAYFRKGSLNDSRRKAIQPESRLWRHMVHQIGRSHGCHYFIFSHIPRWHYWRSIRLFRRQMARCSEFSMLLNIFISIIHHNDEREPIIYKGANSRFRQSYFIAELLCVACVVTITKHLDLCESYRLTVARPKTRPSPDELRGPQNRLFSKLQIDDNWQAARIIFHNSFVPSSLQHRCTRSRA